jgi:hypothetical protein
MIHFLLRALNKRYDYTTCSTASSSSTTVLVRLTVFRRVIMNNTVDSFNI